MVEGLSKASCCVTEPGGRALRHGGQNAGFSRSDFATSSSGFPLTLLIHPALPLVDGFPLCQIPRGLWHFLLWHIMKCNNMLDSECIYILATSVLN